MRFASRAWIFGNPRAGISGNSNLFGYLFTVFEFWALFADNLIRHLHGLMQNIF